MVDHDEIAVARLPAAVDDRPGCCRMDRRAVADADVDALVHPAPAPAERAGDRPGDGPDQSGRRRRPHWRVALGGADRHGERLARRLERVDLARLGAFRRGELGEVDELPLARRREIVARSDELVVHLAGLGGPRRDHCRLGVDAGAQRRRLRMRSAHLHLARRDLARDAPVLHRRSPTGTATWSIASSRSRAPRNTSNVDGARTRRCRRGAGRASISRCPPVAGERPATRSGGGRVVQGVEPVLMQPEVGLERLEAQRDVADPRLECPDARGVVRDLGCAATWFLLHAGDD